MDFVLPPKKDLSITDTQHFENAIVADFISFNMYKERINAQLDEVAVTTTINDKLFYTLVDLKNKLASADSPQRKLLNDFGFTDESIQEIINFNNSEDLNYLRLDWIYKLVIDKDDFDTKINELINNWPGSYEIAFNTTAAEGINILDSVTIDTVTIDISIGQMLYAIMLDNEFNYTSKSSSATQITLTVASIKETAKDLFVQYAGGAEIYDGTIYTVPTWNGTEYVISETLIYFWKGYRGNQSGEYTQKNTSMFHIVEGSSWNNNVMYLSKQDARIARKEEYLKGMSRYMTIDFEVDEGNWFEKFVSGLVNAIMGLIGVVVDLVLAVPILGDFLNQILDAIEHIWSLDSGEALVYLKEVVFAIVIIVIAYYTGQYEALELIGTGAEVVASTYIMAAAEMYSMATTIMSSLNRAEIQNSIIEREARKNDETTEELENNSPENLSANPDAPDKESDYMFESMFTVPDWGIDMTEGQSDNEPETQFLNI